MAPDNSNVDDRTVWVGNLDSRVSEELLWELFLQAGPLESVKIPKDFKTGKLKNFAFVVFQHQVSVNYVIDLLNQIRLFESPLRVSLKNKPSSENASNHIEPDQMRQHFEAQERLNTQSPTPLLQHHPAMAYSMPMMMPPHLLNTPIVPYFEHYPEEAAYMGNAPNQEWEEPQHTRHHRRDLVMRRSYSSPHRLHEENRRTQPYHYGRQYR